MGWVWDTCQSTVFLDHEENLQHKNMLLLSQKELPSAEKQTLIACKKNSQFSLNFSNLMQTWRLSLESVDRKGSSKLCIQHAEIYADI